MSAGVRREPLPESEPPEAIGAAAGRLILRGAGVDVRRSRLRRADVASRPPGTTSPCLQTRASPTKSTHAQLVRMDRRDELHRVTAGRRTSLPARPTICAERSAASIRPSRSAKPQRQESVERGNVQSRSGVPRGCAPRCARRQAPESVHARARRASPEPRRRPAPTHWRMPRPATSRCVDLELLIGTRFMRPDATGRERNHNCGVDATWCSRARPEEVH